jgi:hypothetical protein
VFFLVEQAIKTNRNAKAELYLRVFFFNRKDFNQLTSKKDF